MQATAVWDGTREIGVMEHEGRTFVAGGSVVTPTHAVGYIKAHDDDHWSLVSWDGTRVLSERVEIVSSWLMPRSWLSSQWYAIRATIDGRAYYGRTAGKGMVAHLRARKVA